MQIYRASKDGFSSLAFHTKCDNHTNTLTIVKSKTGYIFGGYTNIPWKTVPKFSEAVGDDGLTFTFSLRDPKTTFKFQYIKGMKEIDYEPHKTGLLGGFNENFYLSSNCDKNNDSFSFLGYQNWAYYIKPLGWRLNEKDSYKYYAGSPKF